MADDPYLEIQGELLRFCAESKYILLFGDFNSRTGTLPDNLKFDENIFEANNLNDLFDENVEILNKFDFYNVPISRVNSDDIVNTYGRHLLELCENNNLFILNGRHGRDRVEPKTTCKDRSTVDYFLSSVDNFAFINDFSILEFSDLYSDVHCPLTLILNTDSSINLNRSEVTQMPSEPKAKVRNWDSKKANIYIENFDVLRVAEIEMKIDDLSNNEDISATSINEVVANKALYLKLVRKKHLVRLRKVLETIKVK